MALYNEILAGRFNRFLQKHLSMKGGPPAAQLQGDIGSNIAFYTGIESMVHQSWDTYGSQLSVAAVAAQNGAIRLRNPVNSGFVAVIFKILAVNVGAAADTPQISQNGPNFITDLTTPIVFTVQRLDARCKPTPGLIGSSQNNFAVSGNLIGRIGLGIGASGDFMNVDDQEIPLLPGDALTYSTVTVNQQATITWWWRERPLEDSEKF